MDIKRLLTNVCSDDLEQSKNFYLSIFDFNINYDTDWFVHLISKEKELELGIISNESEIVPKQARGANSGVYLTFVVESVDELFLKVKKLDIEVEQEPLETSYGQKRMILRAPEGTVCDVSSPSKA